MSASKPHSELRERVARCREQIAESPYSHTVAAGWYAEDVESLLEQLEAAQKAQHVQNLEWAISLAESDPLYAEVFRPYFQKIVDALASNPASEPKEDA